ncbi:LexA family transcriptional regulator [Pantoea sp. 1.19]|uniref:LexA family protein n=1 Tax=Pantoea sp. 1.19 TaxID=1925589 RepID=UPI00094890C5|nr:S24 family peptidase [Pantoea sp. 1.19]
MKTKETISQRIKRLREFKGLSQRALAELCGWASQSRIGNYESGTRAVSVDDAEVIARALGVSSAELLFGSAYKGPYDAGKSYPVLSKVQAGAWGEAIEAYTLKEVDMWLESDAHIQGEAFWLEVEGDSMTAPAGLSIPEGTFVLFDTGRDAINNSLVIAKLSDSNEATFKRLVLDGAQKYLKGLNPQWPMIPVNGNCRIIGVAVETKMRLV